MAKKKSRSRSNRAPAGAKGRSPHGNRPGKPRGATSSGAKAKLARRRAKSNSADADPNVQRLQRVMASAGVGSRRECELIILEGRVEVDDQTVVELGTKVDVTKQRVFVDAVELKLQKLQYFMLNKPPGIVSTSSDPSGRVRVIDLINTRNRVYNVGRLDKSSEGLILVTNDGDLANRLTHPRYGVEKKYHVQVVGHPNRESLQALTDGVYLAEGRAKATGARYLKRAKDTSWIELTLQEGRNREIRRLLAKIGHKVLTLRRVAIGTLRLGELPVGAHRELTAIELRALRKSSGGAGGKASRAKGAAKAGTGAKKATARKKPRDLAEVKELAKRPSRKTKAARKQAQSKTKSRQASSDSKSASAARNSGGRGRAKPVKGAKRKTSAKGKRGRR